MKTVKFIALNWAHQEAYSDSFNLKSYEYALIPEDVDNLPEELKGLIGEPLDKFVSFDRYEDNSYTFEYNNYEIEVDVDSDYNI